MELYLSTCSKAASVAATRTATSSLAEDSQRCGDVEERGERQEKYLSRYQSSSLLDLPLGVKLPGIQGAILYTKVQLSGRFFCPPYGFNPIIPYF